MCFQVPPIMFGVNSWIYSKSAGVTYFVRWGRIFRRMAAFFVADLAPGAVSVYQGGDICRGRSHFMTPAMNIGKATEKARFLNDF